MKEMKMLIDKARISKELSQIGLPKSLSNNSIDTVSIIESFWVSIRIGCFIFSGTIVVRVDEVLRQIFRWKRVASGTTFGRNHAMFLDLYSWFFKQVQFDNDTLGVPLSLTG